MKKHVSGPLPLLAIALAIAASSSLVAQTRGEVKEFSANGITVLLHPTTNELVSTIIGFEGGLASGETGNPALGSFVADLVTSSGSSTRSKDDLRSYLSRTSTSLTGSGDVAGIRFAMTSTRTSFDNGWKVLASIINTPLYDGTEFQNIMEGRISSVKRRWANPDDNAEIVADSLLFLAEPLLGREVREEDLRAVTIDAMKEFMERVRQKRRMIVVVVGDVTEEEMRKKMDEFASMPDGTATPPLERDLASPTEPRVVVVNRKSPTTYVYGRFAGPPSATEDYWPLQVGLSHLRNVLFEEIRTKRNLSYAPGAWLGSTLGASYGSISVSSTRPDSSVGIMLKELKRMKTEEVDAKRLEGSRAVFITVYYQRQMTNGGVANNIYSSWRNTGSWQSAFALDRIEEVTPADVKRVFEKYARNLQFGIAGPATDVTPRRYIFTE